MFDLARQQFAQSGRNVGLVIPRQALKLRPTTEKADDA